MYAYIVHNRDAFYQVPKLENNGHNDRIKTMNSATKSLNGGRKCVRLLMVYDLNARLIDFNISNI